MDEELTDGYREPCAQCSAVDWGVSDEGRFYCRTCHTIIERTTEVDYTYLTPGFSQIIKLGRGRRSKVAEQGRQWMTCEGFQFILRNQANALLRLGVSPGFKDDVLLQLWRRYLQQTRQAYASERVNACSERPSNQPSGSESDAVFSASELGSDRNTPSDAEADADSRSGRSPRSPCSGSADATSYLMGRQRRSGLLNMRRTLALIHVALVWSRESLTLSDLLRLVRDGHVPYVNAHDDLPDEIKLQGRDALIFRSKSVPSYEVVHKDAQNLMKFLQLPAFPPISRQTLLHPALLSLRYLTDANLPDELHPWVCRLMDRTNTADQRHYTFHPSSFCRLPKYDLWTAALIIVTMKILFGLDDHSEWDLSNSTSDADASGNLFHLRKWYRLLQAALLRAQQNRKRDMARKQWTSQKILFLDIHDKWKLMKKKRISEQLRACLEKLSCRPAGVKSDPSGFTFRWGDEDGSDGPSLHQKKLDGVVSRERDVLTPSNSTYWRCPAQYKEAEPALPRSFIWLLQLFSFLLQVKVSRLYKEVLQVERRVFRAGPPPAHLLYR